MHKFDPKNKKRLHSRRRVKMMPAGVILKKIGTLPGQTIVDIGCGSGYFTVPAAKMVGRQGRVYGVDTSAEMLDYAREKSGKIDNLTLIQSSEYDFKLKKNTADIVLIVLVLHEVAKKNLFIKNAKALLRSKGTLAVIEWRKAEMEFGPPLKDRIAESALQKIYEFNGLKNITFFPIGTDYYGVTGKK